MDALDKLAARETKNMHVVSSVHGLIEDQGPPLEKLGVYDEYKVVHQSYARLVDTDLSQEASKRALFIQWFCLTEPPFLSGINDIDRQAELTVLTHLDHLLYTGQTDAELTAMLSHYSTWEYVFQRAEFMHLIALQAFVKVRVGIDTASTTQPIQISTTASRGQMDAYWRSRGGSELTQTT